ncbi:High-affinity branched-chain amino acid transport ATP-binding protein LivF [Candidatus Thermoflexus japonica]|uniref:High-affinity branched-chain amino acid transport ATP-binding protein LivF n=1 Tax=Candidatus Thermoflexus japonica TaxID=2035417 RepID=A0A2H5Y4W7_9CHLR|nr:High-affinity branched-chain amino acid transport ATP-binding protein LivF [Candidatus Thermoflexus japonica]
MLEIEDLHSYYGLSHILQGISMVVPSGQVIALLGRNGMGKTTLVRSIMGLRPPEIRQGRIRYNGHDLVGRPPHEISRLGISLIPQGRRVFPSLTVEENLRIAWRPPRDGQREAWTVERVYELFPRLAERRSQRAKTLSGGEQQMLAIGRALMGNPGLLLLDEPSEGLAPLLVQLLRDQLLALKGTGLAMLLVEQNVGLAMALADEVYLLEKGMIVYHGTPSDLQSRPELMGRYLGLSK